MNTAPLEQRQEELDDETRRLLSQTTTRMVNHAIERRFDNARRDRQQLDAAAKKLWPVIMTILVAVLLASLAWLLVGAR